MKTVLFCFHHYLCSTVAEKERDTERQTDRDKTQRQTALSHLILVQCINQSASLLLYWLVWLRMFISVCFKLSPQEGEHPEKKYEL